METATAINLLQNKKVAIVGAGPGGLTLARLLQRKGANVKVYERDANQNARVQGAIVDLHFDSGLKVIAEAELLEAFKASYMPGADRYRMVDAAANILLDEPIGDTQDDFRNEHFRPEIDRGALRALLITALHPDTVVWDSQFIGMAEVNGGWNLQFKNGNIIYADIVIGAEGYRSNIRPYLSDIKTLYSGATIIQGDLDNPKIECPEIYSLVNNANLIAMGNGKTIAVQPRGNGGMTFYAASMFPENWIKTSGINFNDADEVYGFLLNYYEGWSSVFFELFKACKQFIPRPLDYFPIDQKWESRSNLTLLGDAAHLMPPSGEGVNTAMLDALDLCDCLTNGRYQTVAEAIAAYEEIMLNRAALLAREAVDGIKDFASPTDESVQKLIAMLNENPEIKL